MSENNPITSGCPSIFPHDLPCGFDGVEPVCNNGNEGVGSFRLGETSEKVNLHCSKVVDECREKTGFGGEVHTLFVSVYVDGRLEFAGADVHMGEDLTRAIARGRAFNVLSRMNPYGELSPKGSATK